MGAAGDSTGVRAAVALSLSLSVSHACIFATAVARKTFTACSGSYSASVGVSLSASISASADLKKSLRPGDVSLGDAVMLCGGVQLVLVGSRLARMPATLYRPYLTSWKNEI